MAIKPIGLSFKNTPEDVELYEWIITHSGKSAFIKDILRLSMGSDTSKKVNKISITKSNDLIDMDF